MSTPATPTVSTPAPGVQVLLDAEKEASRQVQQARQCTRSEFFVCFHPLQTGYSG